jgi:hypothetical protein
MKAFAVVGYLVAVACCGPTTRLNDTKAGVSPLGDPVWPPGPTSVAHKLGVSAKGQVLLVEEQGAIVARTASGSVVRDLFKGQVSRATYDPRVSLIWFIHDGQLLAIDLGDTTEGAVAIVDDMPDLSFDAGHGTSVAQPMCDACVTVSAMPPAVGVTTEAIASGGQLQGEEWRRFDRDSKIAASAHPRLSASATGFLDRLGRREERSAQAWLRLDDQTWPLPRSAGSRDLCAADCTRAFHLARFGWRLVVAGRECDCNDDRCNSLCVLYDPATTMFARPSQPTDFRADIKPENGCHPILDATGTAYILDDHRVCTVKGCITLSGRILGWVEPGTTTSPVQEDSNACPEGPV